MRDNSAVAESFADMAAAAKHGSLHTDKGGNTVGCSSPSIRNEVAMHIMYLAVKQLRYDRTKIIHSLTKEIRYVLSEIPGASSSDSLRSQISLISEKQTKLLDLYMNDEIGKDEYTRERTRFETEIQELKMQIIGRECAGTLKKDSDLLYDDIVKVINELADGVEYEDEFYRCLLDKMVVVDRDTVDVYLGILPEKWRFTIAGAAMSDFTKTLNLFIYLKINKFTTEDKPIKLRSVNAYSTLRCSTVVLKKITLKTANVYLLQSLFLISSIILQSFVIQHFKETPKSLILIGFGGFSVTNLLLVQSNKFIVSFNSSSVLWV